MEAIIEEDKEFQKKVRRVAVKAAIQEGLKKDDYSNPPYNGNFKAYALDKIAVFQWIKWERPYFAGIKDWGLPSFGKEEWLCREWVESSMIKIQSQIICSEHSKENIIFKCKFCWNEATYFWWETTHFWSSCHLKQEKDPYYESTLPEKLTQCNGKDRCPLGIEHPLNGTESVPLKCLLWFSKQNHI